MTSSHENKNCFTERSYEKYIYMYTPLHRFKNIFCLSTFSLRFQSEVFIIMLSTIVVQNCISERQFMFNYYLILLFQA